MLSYDRDSECFLFSMYKTAPRPLQPEPGPAVVPWRSPRRSPRRSPAPHALPPTHPYLARRSSASVRSHVCHSISD